MYYYQFNIGDYKSHTSHLDPIEDITYRRLLDLYYQSEQPIPSDIEKVSRLICMRTHCECIANVLDEFFILTDEGYLNKRADREIMAYNEKSEKAKKSAETRWAKNRKDANAMRTQCERNAKQETLNTKHETQNTKQETVNTKQKTNYDSDFDLFWKTTNYPKRPQDAKGAIKKKYLKAIKDGVTPEDISTAANIFAESHKGDQYAIGLRAFMEKDNIEQYLENDIVKGKEDNSKVAPNMTVGESYIERFKTQLTANNNLLEAK